MINTKFSENDKEIGNPNYYDGKICKRIVKKEKNLVNCLLAECAIDQEITISRVEAGQRAKSRLADLGIVPGVKIIIKKTAPFKGPIEIYVKGTALVLGRGLASKITVVC